MINTRRDTRIVYKAWKTRSRDIYRADENLIKLVTIDLLDEDGFVREDLYTSSTIMIVSFDNIFYRSNTPILAHYDRLISLKVVIFITTSFHLL